VQDILNSSDEELFQLVANLDNDFDFGSQPESNNEKARRGKRIFNRLISENRKNFCKHPLILKLQESDQYDPAILLGLVIHVAISVGIFDQGADQMIGEMSAFATLLIRMGFGSVCGGISLDD
jgi:hypothetical protein